MSIRVAVVGLGIGREHLKAYLKIPGCQIAAISDFNRELANQVRDENGLSCPILTFEEIISDSGIDAVSLASFDSHHADQVVRALLRGKHVFVEKPLCKTATELSSIFSAWKSTKKHLRSNLVLRSAPIYSWMAEAAGRGEFGNLFSVDADYLYGRLEKITNGWRSNEPGYSVFAGGGIHMVDLLLRITGQRPVSVVARGSGLGTRGTSFQFDDFVTANLIYDSGLIGRVNANFACVHPHQHSFRLFGTKASVLIDDQGARIFRERGDSRMAERIDISSRYESKGVLIPEFVRAISEGQNPVDALNKELDLMSVVVAVDQALVSGIEVKIEYLR